MLEQLPDWTTIAGAIAGAVSLVMSARFAWVRRAAVAAAFAWAKERAKRTPGTEDDKAVEAAEKAWKGQPRP